MQTPTWLDAIAFSSALVAGVAGVLAWAASLAMGLPPDPAVAALAAGGTFVVYTVDRLRDRQRDQRTAPARTAFVERHRALLAGLAAAAAAAAAALAWRLGPRAWAVCAGVGALGLLHRRLKRVPVFKGIYVASAWIVVAVGLPAWTAPGARDLPWVVAVLGTALLANVVASSLRDDESVARWLPERTTLALARALAAAGLVIAAAGPEPAEPLGMVPATLLAVLLVYRRGERFGLIAVDGALLVGGLGAIALDALR